MRITKVNIPKEANDKGENDGLEAIKMDKLGQVVLLAGKNGSGKTRILNKIIQKVQFKPSQSQINSLPTTIKSYENNIKIFTDAIALINLQIERGEEYDITIRASHEQSLKNSQSRLENTKKLLTWDLLTTNTLAEEYTIVQFVPKRLKLSDSNDISKNELKSAADRINAVGLKTLHEGALAKIQYTQDRWFNANHQHSTVSNTEKDSASKDYEKLKELIKIFLNSDLLRNINGDATLFGFPFGKANFSDGQIILLQFCMAIYSQEIALKDLILVMDEPENHLHPSIIIETIERLIKCVPEGQIWIATHSIPLLAHFDPSMIWFVENGEVKHAGKIPEKVLESLLGDESEIAKLQDFISLPAQYATSRYAFESLLEPQVLLTGSNDPQTRQIRKNLLDLVGESGKLRILDFGAGKGRLIANIAEQDESGAEKLIDKIDYIAFDAYGDDKEMCESAIALAYGTSENRYFNDFKTLLGIYDKDSFDVVLMCNVLHEIDPKDWLTLFKPDGKISQLLKETGILLLVEDQQIPIGEKAYQKGFLVLDTPHLKDLFKITETCKDFVIDDKRKDGRLKAHHIPKRCLIQIDGPSRLKAIQAISNTAKDEILSIRGKEKNYHNGKLHGFWTQQFANAQLNIAELT